MTAQAADGVSGPITLLQSPALGSLSSLGGVSGYIASQSEGDTNAWLAGQDIDPTAAGSITDATIPAQAQGKITVDGDTASLASDADGVNVGYLVGDAQGTDTITASVSDIAVAAGHENDNFAMTQAEYLTWLNGTTWHGHCTLPGYADFDYIITWTPTGAVVSTTDTNPMDAILIAQVQNVTNQGTRVPGSIPIKDVLAGNPPYSWDASVDVPYSFAYAVGQALTPGGSVSVDLNDVISSSPLSDYTVSGLQTSGALANDPLTSWLSPEAIQVLSSLPQFPSVNDTMTTADLASAIMTEFISQGEIDTLVAGYAVQEINSIIDDDINALSSSTGYVVQHLDADSEAIIAANTPAVMAMFLNDGFADQLAQAMSATVNVSSALDPGTVTSLVPTGVTAAQSPVQVDPAQSTLTLSDSDIVINPDAACTNSPIVDPSTITAAATVVDTTGAPIAGTQVTFGADDPLSLSPSTTVTDENGIATTHISLNDQDAAAGVRNVTAHVDFGSGADLNPAHVSITRVQTVTPGVPTLSVTPTSGSPVLANGEDSYTASITLINQCGIQADTPVSFTVSGSAQVSPTDAVTDAAGIATAIVTDTVAEPVSVTVQTAGAQIGDQITVNFTAPPTQSASPTESPSQSPSDSQSPTTPPSESPTIVPSESPTTILTTEPPTTNPTTEPPTTPPSESPSPSQTTALPCTGPTTVGCVQPPMPADGTLTVNSEAVVPGGSALVTAHVLGDDGSPVANVPVSFHIGGNAQFADGSTSTTSSTDSNGDATVLVTATAVDCDNPGFDVYASISIAVVQLSGSPVHVAVTVPDDACEVPVAPPQVNLANATIIAGDATPGATVQIVTATGTVLGTSLVDMTGYWSVPTPAGTPSQQITANALNSKGTPVASTTAWLDTDLPALARIDRANTQEVAGNIGAVESSATLTVIFPDGSMITALANADGSYSVATPDGMVVGTVTVVVTDTAGNRSTPATATLVTYVPPTSKVTVTVKNAQVTVGGQQTVTGRGFKYLERVTAQLCSTTSTTCTTVGTGLALLSGQVSITFTVPDTITNLGTYTVTLTGPTTGTGSTTFQVIAPTAPPVTKGCAYLLWWAKWWWLLA